MTASVLTSAKTQTVVYQFSVSTKYAYTPKIVPGMKSSNSAVGNYYNTDVFLPLSLFRVLCKPLQAHILYFSPKL